VDDDLLEDVFDMFNANTDIIKQIDAIGKKVDLLLDEAHTSSLQLLRDAYTAFDAQNYEETIQMFREEDIINLLKCITFVR
jgi:hypothetical protein